jgi:hypothetical protein
MGRLANFLGAQRTHRLLLLLNLLVGVAVFWLFRDTISGDQATYLGLAEGMRHGQYSYWYFLDDYIPDTFRTPGYPLFLWTMQLLWNDIFFVKVVQLLMYWCAVLLVDRSLAARHAPDRLVQNVFLLLCLPNIQVVYYAALIFPETLMVFLVALSVYVEASVPDGRRWKSPVLGSVWGLVSLTRPVFLLYPLVRLVGDALIGWGGPRSGVLKKYALVLLCYGLVLAPYGWWNAHHHGVFSVTPLEGGGGVVHTGFWHFRLPDYTEHRYWGNHFSEEPCFPLDAQERTRYIALYNQEWDQIDAACDGQLTAHDRVLLAEMAKHPALFPTYNTAYTLTRERMLKTLWLDHVRAEPWYYFKTRLYTAVRLFVTAPRQEDLRTGTAWSVLRGLYPTVVTFCTFIVGGFVLGLALVRKRETMWAYYPVLLLIGYYWMIHLPMSIQARYTVPIHLPFLMMLAVAVGCRTSRATPGLPPQ